MTSTLALLLDSAIRSLLLGLGVWLLLRLLSLRDARAEIAIWIAVLAAALCMPLLIRALPGFALPDIALPSVPQMHLPARAGQPALIVITTTAQPPAWPSHLWGWLKAHRELLLWCAYGLPVLVSLARLATGLSLTARLYAQAEPITAGWAEGKAIRASAQVSGPISFGRRIILPADFGGWSNTKLLAVLAHEESHVARGDFFVLLLAALYRALFWFSPFAWWLQARLCALAETASDEAAARLLDDRATYAEILLDVSRRANRIPALIAMAKGPDIGWRVDRILDEAPVRTLGARARIMAAMAILPAACMIAGAHAAVAPMVKPVLLTNPPLMVPFLTARAETEKPAAAAVPRQAVAGAPHARKVKLAKAVPAPSESEVTYNPRALLEDSDATVLPMLLTTGSGKKGQSGSNKSGGDAVTFLNNVSNN
jgi:beta-lactamase regulating signal transducer with metallopeptidase domain